MTADVDALSRPNVLLLLASLRARLVVLTSPDGLSTTKKVLEEKKPAGGGGEKAEKKKPAGTKKRRTGGENAAPPSAVKDLVGMGFPAKKARDAIEATGGDVQDCVNWLVANM